MENYYSWYIDGSGSGDNWELGTDWLTGNGYGIEMFYQEEEIGGGSGCGEFDIGGNGWIYDDSHYLNGNGHTHISNHMLFKK